MTDERAQEKKHQKTPSLETPLLKKVVKPKIWLDLLKRRSGGHSFSLNSICGNCRLVLTSEEIFSGFDPDGGSNVLCPRCRKNSGSTTITVTSEKSGRTRKISLIGPSIVASQISLLPKTPAKSQTLSKIPALQLNAIFWTGSTIE